MSDPAREAAYRLALARVDALWERLIRPSLRAQAERMTALDGRRPAPGDMVAIVGELADVRAIARPGLLGDEARELVCVVVARVNGPGHGLRAPYAALLAAALGRIAPAALPVAWVTPDGFDVVAMHDVVDTGPEGAAINCRPARGPAS